MGQRRKCTTEFIQNDKARLATFQRRSHCLLKKASELSILCDVDVAVLIYADHLSDRPLIFPPESGESLRIIKKLKANPRYVPGAKSKPDKFLNQENHSMRPNHNFCDDITSLNVDELNALVRILDAKEEEVLKKIDTIRQRKNEAGVDEISDPNCFFSGDDHQSDMFDHQQHRIQWPVSFSVMGMDDTHKSKSEHLNENNSGILNQISGHLNDHYDDKIMSLNGGEMDSFDQIWNAMEEDEIATIGEKSNEMRNCLNFSENISDEFSDPNCFFISGDDLPTPSVSEITTDLESEFFDHQPPGFQWPIPCSYKVDDDTPILEPHHLTKNSSGLLDFVVPILDAKPAAVKNESNMTEEKTMETRDCESFSDSSDGESLAALFHDELPDTSCFFFNSENPMYHHQSWSLDYQPFGFQRPISYSDNNL